MTNTSKSVKSSDPKHWYALVLGPTKSGKMYFHSLFDIRRGIRGGSICLIYDESRGG